MQICSSWDGISAECWLVVMSYLSSAYLNKKKPKTKILRSDAAIKYEYGPKPDPWTMLPYFPKVGLITISLFHLCVTSFQSHSRHGRVSSVCGRSATVLFHLLSKFTSEIILLQDCVRDVLDWFLTNGMLLNGDKS